MNETFYLVDNNALNAIKTSRIRTGFFRDRCRVTSDVVYEASGHPALDVLTGVEITLSPRTVQHMRAIMAAEDPNATDLVDLYANKGAADPVLLAALIELAEHEQAQFFSDEWVLVTADKAVLERALRFEISALSPDSLADLIDRSIEQRNE